MVTYYVSCLYIFCLVKIKNTYWNLINRKLRSIVLLYTIVKSSNDLVSLQRMKAGVSVRESESPCEPARIDTCI